MFYPHPNVQSTRRLVKYFSKIPQLSIFTLNDDSASEAFVHDIPVEDVPPSGDVISAAILVVQIVGMFPYIEADQWLAEIGISDEAFHQWVVLIGSGGDF